MKTPGKKALVMAKLANILPKPDIICLQETHLFQGKDKFSLPGYMQPLMGLAGTHKAGIMTLVRKNLQADKSNTPIIGSRIEHHHITVHLPHRKLTIINIYRHATVSLETETISATLNQPNTIAVGDLNAHHTLWGSTSNDIHGRQLATAILESNSVCLNTGDSTHIRGGRLDLTIASPEVASVSEWVVDETTLSDHYAIITSLQITKSICTPAPQGWKYSKANWALFAKTLDNLLDDEPSDTSVSEMEHRLTIAFQTAAQRAIPRTKRGKFHANHWYFTEKVKNAINMVNQHTTMFRTDPTPENKCLLRRVQSWAQDVTNKAKCDAWFQFCETLNAHTTCTELWNQVRVATGRGKLKTPTYAKPHQQAEQLMTEYAKRASGDNLSPEVQQLQDSLKPAREALIQKAIDTPDPIQDRPYTIHEFQIALQQGRNTAPGSDGIKQIMLDNMGPVASLTVLDLCNAIHTKQTYPEVWKEAEITPIPKSPDSAATRPISLLKVLSKLMERLARRRIQCVIGPPSERIFGYTNRVGTTDAIGTTIAEISSNIHQHNTRATIVVFLDLTRAFESCPREAIMEALVSKGLKGNLAAYASELLKDRVAAVKVQGEVSTYMPLKKGTPQGGVLSPLFFNQLMEHLVSLPYPEGSKVLSYADDLTHLTHGEKDSVLHTAQLSLDLLSQHADILGLSFSPVKCKAICCGMVTPSQQLYLQGGAIEWVDHHKMLGIHIDRRLSFKPHVEAMTARIQKRLNAMKALCNLVTGTNCTIIQLIYERAIRAILDYSAVVLILASKTSLDGLERLQNRALRTILGAPVWTKLLTMRSQSNIPSVKDRLTYMQISFLIRTVKNPRESTLQSLFLRDLQADAACQPRTWSQKICSLAQTVMPNNELHIYGPDYRRIPPLQAWEKIPCTFIIHRASCKKSLCNPHDLKAEYLANKEGLDLFADAIVYTDGSVSEDGKAGCGGLALIQRKPRCFAARVSDHASTLQTEIAAIYATLGHKDLLGITNEMGIVFHTDSMSAIMALQQDDPADNICLITDTQRLIQEHVQHGGSITINYVPSHVGIAGNETADRMAKKATLKDNITMTIPPSISQNQKLAKRHLSRLAKQAYRDQIGQSDSITWHNTASNNIMVPKHLNRVQQVALNRLCLGYRCNWEIDRRVLRECPECSRPTQEPLLHYVLECTHTQPAFGPPLDIEGTDRLIAITTAATRVNTLLKNHSRLLDLLSEHPAPR